MYDNNKCVERKDRLTWIIHTNFWLFTHNTHKSEWNTIIVNTFTNNIYDLSLIIFKVINTVIYMIL